MKNWKKLLWCAALAICGTMLVSCSDEDESQQNIEGPVGPETPAVTLSDVTVEAYYAGDYNEAGTGNLWINIAQGDIGVEYDDFDDTEVYTGTGWVLCIDLNQTLADDPDKVVLEPGTYSVDTTESYAEGVINAEESYLLNVVDGEGASQAVTAGSVTITALGDLIYTIECDLTVADGTKVKDTYTVLCRPMNRSDEGVMSNLDKDIVVDDLTQGLFLYYGDLFETEESEMYVVILAADDFDLYSNYGRGNNVTLYLNVEQGSAAGIPSGTYDTFIDIEEAESLPAGSCLSGLYSWGTFMGCWYLNLSNQYEARLVDGSVEVENNADIYTLRGSLLDANGNTVSFSYTGTPAIYADTYSVKSAGLRSHRLSKR